MGTLEEALAELTEKESQQLSDEQMAEDLTLIGGNPTVARMTHLWKNAWARGGHGFCPTLSGKDQGNLKTLRGHLGGTIACHLIVAAVENWAEFRKAVEKETAFDHSAMLRPTVWFLLTNEAEGVAWLVKRAKSSENGSQGVSGGKDWSVLDD